MSGNNPISRPSGSQSRLLPEDTVRVVGDPTSDLRRTTASPTPTPIPTPTPTPTPTSPADLTDSRSEVDVNSAGSNDDYNCSRRKASCSGYCGIDEEEGWEQEWLEECYHEGLISRYPPVSSVPSRVSDTSGTLPLRLRTGHHFPVYTEVVRGAGKGKRKQFRCVRCTALRRRVVVTIRCKLCNVPLCIGACWREYHTVKDLRKSSES